MTNPNIFKSLLPLQDKHRSFFVQTNTSVIDYLEISWRPQLKVRINDHVPDTLLPDLKSELRHFLN